MIRWLAAFADDGRPVALYRLDDRGGWRFVPETGVWEPSDTPGAVVAQGSDRADEISETLAEQIAAAFGRRLDGTAASRRPLVLSRPPDDCEHRREWIDEVLDGLGAPE